MNKLNDYQSRQILVLKQKIIEYELKRLALPYLINDIEDLIDLLADDRDWDEKIDKDWIKKIDRLLFELEIIYATNITEDGYKRYLMLTEKDQEEIDAILAEMKKMVNEQLLLIPEPEW
jgi:hypothetical protein